MKRILRTLIAIVAVMLLAGSLPVVDAAAGTGTERAAWLLQRGADTGGGLMDTRHFQTEVGGGGLSTEETLESPASPRGAVGLKMLASAVLPGTGEVLLGHKHGFILMAADILAWTQVSKYNSDGNDMRDAYYAFADEHYSDHYLAMAYRLSADNSEDGYHDRFGEAGRAGYYLTDFPNISSLTGPGYSQEQLEEALENTLPLYVTKDEDRRKYYENLGKWDQFVFGWDDYLKASDPQNWPDGQSPTYQISDLRQPWVSKNREIYRTMREDANAAFEKRDRWLYVNIGLRVFSVLETAWLGGLFGGEDDAMAVAGHRVQLVTAPEGPYRGRVGAKVWF